MDLSTLKTLMDLKYQKSQASLTKVLEREKQLKSEISRLRGLAFEAQSLSAATPTMQNIGADVIWLKWVSKMLRSLNMELSQVLSQKEIMRASHSKEFGKQQVAELLLKDSIEKNSQRMAYRELSESVDCVLHSPRKR